MLNAAPDFKSKDNLKSAPDSEVKARRAKAHLASVASKRAAAAIHARAAVPKRHGRKTRHELLEARAAANHTKEWVCSKSLVSTALSSMRSLAKSAVAAIRSVLTSASNAAAANGIRGCSPGTWCGFSRRGAQYLTFDNFAGLLTPAGDFATELSDMAGFVAAAMAASGHAEEVLEGRNVLASLGAGSGAVPIFGTIMTGIDTVDAFCSAYNSYNQAVTARTQGEYHAAVCHGIAAGMDITVGITLFALGITAAVPTAGAGLVVGVAAATAAWDLYSNAREIFGDGMLDVCSRAVASINRGSTLPTDLEEAIESKFRAGSSRSVSELPRGAAAAQLHRQQDAEYSISDHGAKTGSKSFARAPPPDPSASGKAGGKVYAVSGKGDK